MFIPEPQIIHQCWLFTSCSKTDVRNTTSNLGLMNNTKNIHSQYCSLFCWEWKFEGVSIRERGKNEERRVIIPDNNLYWHSVSLLLPFSICQFNHIASSLSYLCARGNPGVTTEAAVTPFLWQRIDKKLQREEKKMEDLQINPLDKSRFRYRSSSRWFLFVE